MSKNIIARFFAPLAICASFSTVVYANDPLRLQAARLFEECVAVSKKIERGEMLLAFSVRNERYPDMSHKKELHIVFDGDKALIIRQDGGSFIGYAFNCFQQDTFAYFRSSPSSMMGTPLPADMNIYDIRLDQLEIYPADYSVVLKNSRNTLEFSIPTPPYLYRIGMVGGSTGNIERLPLGDFVDILKGEEGRWKSNLEEALQDDKGGFFGLKIEEDILDGDACIKVSWHWVLDIIATDRKVIGDDGRELFGSEKTEYLRPSRTQGTNTVWFDKLRHLLRKEVALTQYAYPSIDPNAHEYSPTVGILENRLTQDSETELWYPSSWTYTQIEGIREKLYSREEGTLEYISINQSISAERFALENIAPLTPDAPVHWHLDSKPPGVGELVWDGERIVGLGLDLESLERDVRKRRILLIVLCNVLLVSAFVLWYLYRLHYCQSKGTL
ncbi:MAG: hypothetical protein FWG73_02090 [Planctomycetaceae bacterium]|nr:hypothetical protein [Planctomycetaceae bacterium]